MLGKLTQQQIEELLKDNVLGHLGCNDGFNTYVYPINYFYDGKYINCHSQLGFKIKVMARNPRVCLQVDEVKDHKNWKSVVVLGKFQEVNDELEQHKVVEAFADRRLFLKINGSTSIPTIYRIVIDEKTGRYEDE
jgi:nitroimidazol reductase NimA-like FMN-containing flavoprotein (pyridoxamine 5'-phosphate oxidase superfamily)